MQTYVDIVEALSQQLQELSEETILFHEAVANELELHSTDHKCLAILGRSGPLSASELGARLGLSKSAVTFMLDRLEKKQLLKRTASPSDRRKILIEPLETALTVQLQARFRALEKSIRAELSTYSDGELQTIQRFIAATKSILQQRPA